MSSKTKKKSKYHCLTYKPRKEDKDRFVDKIFKLQHKLVYKRLESGKYRIYCYECGKYQTISKDLFKQVQASNLCPCCHREVRLSRTLDDTYRDLVMICKGKDSFGFRVVIQWQFGRKPKVTSAKQVLYDDGLYCYRKDIVKNMYSIVDTETDGWKKCNPLAYYQAYFYKADRVIQEEPLTRKEYYIRERIEFLPLKSNQATLVKDNLFNANQILYIILFDLKNVDQVLKYRAYMKQNDAEYEFLEHKLNVYYLDYLHRNKISLIDFIDYANQCDELEIKLDKPRDFQKKHGEYSLRLLEIKDEVRNKQIQKRAKRKDIKGYSSNGYEIYPFNSVGQIHKCAKEFHNCIASYIDKYAKGKTALYHMDVDGEMVVAIEVKQGRLIQARQKMNENCTKEQMKHIRKWCRLNSWKY